MGLSTHVKIRLFVLSTCTGTNQPVRFQEWHLQTVPATQDAAHSESLRHIQ